MYQGRPEQCTLKLYEGEEKIYPFMFSVHQKGLASILAQNVMSLQASQDRENALVQQLSRFRCSQALVPLRCGTALHRRLQMFIGTHLNKFPKTTSPPPSSVIKHRETFWLQFLITGFWTLWDVGEHVLVLAYPDLILCHMLVATDSILTLDFNTTQYRCFTLSSYYN